MLLPGDSSTESTTAPSKLIRQPQGSQMWYCLQAVCEIDVVVAVGEGGYCNWLLQTRIGNARRREALRKTSQPSCPTRTSKSRTAQTTARNVIRLFCCLHICGEHGHSRSARCSRNEQWTQPTQDDELVPHAFELISGIPFYNLNKEKGQDVLHPAVRATPLEAWACACIRIHVTHAWTTCLLRLVSSTPHPV